MLDWIVVPPEEGLDVPPLSLPEEETGVILPQEDGFGVPPLSLPELAVLPLPEEAIGVILPPEVELGVPLLPLPRVVEPTLGRQEPSVQEGAVLVLLVQEASVQEVPLQ